MRQERGRTYSNLLRYSQLEPGGWLEIQLLTLEYHEPDTLSIKSQKIRELHTLLCDATAHLGRKWNIHEDLPRLLGEAQFQNIAHLQKCVPLGPWEEDGVLV